MAVVTNYHTCGGWKEHKCIQLLFKRPEDWDEGISRRQWHPTPVLLPGKSHGQRSLVGCSLWGREESDMTERLHFHFSLSCIGEGNGNPLQYSCLEKNPRDGGAWWAAIYGVAQSRTRLKRLSSSILPLKVSGEILVLDCGTPWIVATSLSPPISVCFSVYVCVKISSVSLIRTHVLVISYRAYPDNFCHIRWYSQIPSIRKWMYLWGRGYFSAYKWAPFKLYLLFCEVPAPVFSSGRSTFFLLIY